MWNLRETDVLVRKYLNILFCISFTSCYEESLIALVMLKSGTGASELRYDRHANFLEHVGTEEATAGEGG